MHGELVVQKLGGEITSLGRQGEPVSAMGRESYIICAMMGGHTQFANLTKHLLIPLIQS